VATKLLTRRSPYPVACILTFILIEIESKCFHSTNEIVCCTHCSRDLFLANCCHQLMTWHCIWSRVLHSICWYCGLLFHKLFIRKFYLLWSRSLSHCLCPWPKGNWPGIVWGYLIMIPVRKPKLGHALHNAPEVACHHLVDWIMEPILSNPKCV